MDDAAERRARWHGRRVEDLLPDVRDGLNRRQRIVLTQLHRLQKERGGRNVPTAQLYGRVCEFINMTPEELTRVLQQLGAMRR